MARNKAFDEQNILEKAMHLFWSQGYYNTSMQELVNHLGINRGSLYDTYGCKKELFNSAFEHYRNINIQNLSSFFKSQSKVKVGFKNLFLRALDESSCDTERKGCFVINTAMELLPLDKAIEAQVIQNSATIKSIFSDFIESGKSNGELDPNTNSKLMSSLIFTMYNGIKVMTKVEQDDSEILQSVDTILDLM